MHKYQCTPLILVGSFQEISWDYLAMCKRHGTLYDLLASSRDTLRHVSDINLSTFFHWTHTRVSSAQICTLPISGKALVWPVNCMLQSNTEREKHCFPSAMHKWLCLNDRYFHTFYDSYHTRVENWSDNIWGTM